MKITRLKHVRRILSFYHNSLGINEPYQILVDGTFCQAALSNKIYIKEQLPKYLDGSVNLCTTKCVVHEGRNLVDTNYPSLLGAVLIAKRFYQKQCHHKSSLPAAECILDLIGEKNQNHYFVATQDKDLRAALRKIGCVPILYINYNAIILEKPSMKTKTTAENITHDKLQPSQYQKEVLNLMKKAYLPESQTKFIKRKKRKRPAEPNPLSCKKKKKQIVTAGEETVINVNLNNL
ncbi:uncharacterized protein TRIADDRAFT_24331 [Trichoplax adhaerens]|uniref:rRNA-processing protein UTP23 homolog n=1 Tax=Trichoplax adhaerens TaxID=10228 RepID=B3RUL8_TRIAD|nr:hypothetical protein TRIADDRAFT_24331 [Trichoplax adhaerens]EDV25842.1 hypothetical protein TRIADDRAFT_24331 [Trichoplax adhaerens]|eukprot:XP_002111875.1 hypothetical protein TRIADDRAFT_24331 [Trichoplax adhaerens]